MKLINGVRGFARVEKNRRGNITLCVEGRDEDGPSVSGLELTPEQATKLAQRLRTVVQALGTEVS